MKYVRKLVVLLAKEKSEQLKNEQLKIEQPNVEQLRIVAVN